MHLLQGNVRLLIKLFALQRRARGVRTARTAIPEVVRAQLTHAHARLDSYRITA